MEIAVFQFLFMVTKFSISCNIHMSQKILSILFHPFKNVPVLVYLEKFERDAIHV